MFFGADMVGQVVLMGGNYVVKAQPYYPPLEAGFSWKMGRGFQGKYVNIMGSKQQEWNVIANPKNGQKQGSAAAANFLSHE